MRSVRFDRDTALVAYSLIAFPLVVAVGLGQVGVVGFWVALASVLIVEAVCVALWAAANRLATRRRSSIRTLSDPTFGMLRYIGNETWEGECEFAGQSGVTISVDAPTGGPVDEQRRLFKEIREQYARVYPAIVGAVERFVGRQAIADELELVAIEVSAKPEMWSAQYSLSSDDEYGYSYFVEVTHWSVEGVTAGD